MLYRYAWGNNKKRETLKGRTCKIVATYEMNFVIIEFIDNKQRVFVSLYSLRKVAIDINKETSTENMIYRLRKGNYLNKQGDWKPQERTAVL